MYSDKIFPRPFPPVCQFFHPFLRLAPPPLSLFPPIVSFFPVRATAAKSRFVLFPRRTNFPALCRRLLSPPSCTVQAFSFSRSLISRRPLSFLSFSLCPLFFPVPRRPTFLYCAGGCPVCHNFPVFFDGIDKKSGVRPVIFQTIAKRGTMPAALSPEIVF